MIRFSKDSQGMYVCPVPSVPIAAPLRGCSLLGRKVKTANRADMSVGEVGCSGTEPKTEGTAESIYRPSMYLNASGGYWFFGITNTNGSVPMMVPDPEMTFNKIAITSLMIARFLNGPLGPFDYVRPVGSLSSCRFYGHPG